MSKYGARVALSMLYKRVRDQDRLQRWRIVRGDKVQVMSGKDKGKQGEITEVRRKQNAVIIAGINLVKKTVKSTEDRKGGIFQREAPVHIAKVALLDPSDNLPTKTNFKFVEQGGKIEKVRISKRTNLVIPKPAILTKKRPVTDGPKDTDPEIVFGSYRPTLEAADATKKLLAKYTTPQIEDLLNSYQKARPPPRKAKLAESGSSASSASKQPASTLA